jgi:hypothetical protein
MSYSDPIHDPANYDETGRYHEPLRPEPPDAGNIKPPRWPEVDPQADDEWDVYDRHISIGYSRTEARRKVADYRRANPGRCACDFDASSTGGLCDTCGLPQP